MKFLHKKTLFALCLCIFVAGCDEETIGPDPISDEIAGEFEATSFTFTGEAGTADAIAGDATFTIEITPGGAFAATFTNPDTIEGDVDVFTGSGTVEIVGDSIIFEGGVFGGPDGLAPPNLTLPSTFTFTSAASGLVLTAADGATFNFDDNDAAEDDEVDLEPASVNIELGETDLAEPDL